MHTVEELRQYIRNRKENEGILIEEKKVEKDKWIQFNFIHPYIEKLPSVRLSLVGEHNTLDSKISSVRIGIGKNNLPKIRDDASISFFGFDFQSLHEKLSQDFALHELGKYQITCINPSHTKGFVDKLLNLNIKKSNDIDAYTDIENHYSDFKDKSKTERNTLIKSRIGQGNFRKDVIDLWKSCAVTGMDNCSVLRASHIRPWRNSDNTQRLCPYNGLLLVPNLDALFDKGLISFDSDGKIMISNKLSENDREFLGIHADLCLQKKFPEVETYMSYHREHIFET